MPLVLEPSKSGLKKVLREYQIEALRIVWNTPNPGVTSREVYQHVNKALGEKTVSRASIINFLNSMCDEGVLVFEEETCKGGMRRKYSPGMDEKGFKKYIAKTVLDSLMKDFPEQTVEVLRETFGAKATLVAGL